MVQRPCFSFSMGCQAWHNSTYNLMRVFSVPAFALYVWLESCWAEAITADSEADRKTAQCQVNFCSNF